MPKVAVALAVLLVVSSNVAQAENDSYYECTKPDGFMEYSLFECEDGAEQKYIGNKETPKSPTAVKKNREVVPVPHHEQRQGGEGQISKEFHLASYKCVGKSGDILFTDARDYLAFETYRCKRISLNMACDEALELKTKDPLAVVSIKLQCP